MYRIAVGCGYALEEQKNFHQNVLEFLKKHGFDGELGAYQVGATIGVHTALIPSDLEWFKNMKQYNKKAFLPGEMLFVYAYSIISTERLSLEIPVI